MTASAKQLDALRARNRNSYASELTAGAHQLDALQTRKKKSSTSYMTACAQEWNALWARTSKSFATEMTASAQEWGNTDPKGLQYNPEITVLKGPANFDLYVIGGGYL